MTGAWTLTLAEFLLARIAEDEATARHYLDASATGHRYAWIKNEINDEDLHVDPRFVLAECEAKRRIVDVQAATHGAAYESYIAEDIVDKVLALLALPYADHPDYREEWRP